MLYLIAIILSIALFGAFIGLTVYEGAHGVRFLGRTRDRLDTRAARVFFIIGHVDWTGFLAHAAGTMLEHAAHEAAHGALKGVRALERVLTRTVRTLRTRNVERMPEAALTPVRTAPMRLRGTVDYITRTLRTSRRKSKEATFEKGIEN